MIAIVAFVLFATVNAHNWVNSPSRSVNANPIKPSMPSETGQPHLQVIAGQKFQIEWVTGHDSYVYWILLSAKDKKALLKQSNKMIEDYVNNAPASQQKPPSDEWAKYHRKYKDEALDYKGKALWDRAIKPGQPGYIERPAVFEGSFSGSPGTKSSRFNSSLVYQMHYKNGECIDGDRRVFYKNPDAPHIIGIQRYKICTGHGSRPDVAHFAFPKDTPPGNYYVQYNWRGYYDIVDVQVVAGTTPVAKIYGEKPEPLPKGTPAEYRRIDHCVFPEAEPINICIRMMSDASVQGCKTMCDWTTIVGCTGVNVVPLKNPPTVYKHFQNISYIPDGYDTVCRKSTLLNKAPEGARVCYPLLAREATQTAGRYIVSDDPEDPIFYSSCYVRIRQTKLAGAPAAKPEAEVEEVESLFQQRCVDCKTAQLATLDYSVPVWNLQDKCMNCDLDGPKLADIPKPTNVTAPMRFKKFTDKMTCDNTRADAAKGTPARPTFTCANAKQSCWREKRYPGTSGRADVAERDCVAMIKADPACSNQYMFRYKKTDFWNIKCYCWSTESCCGPCVAKKDNNMKLWEL